MLLNRSKAQNGMPEFDNPSFLRLGSRLAFGSLLPRCFIAIWGSNWRLGLPELFLGVPEMIEPVMDLGLLGDCSPNRLVPSSQPRFLLQWPTATLLNIALPAALVALASSEEDLVSTAKALEQFGTTGLGSFRTPLRFDGDEDFAPLVRAISATIFGGQLRSEFRSCEIDVTVLRNGTRVPNPLSQLRNTLRNGTFGAKSRFSISQCVSQLRNGCYCTAKWHSCAKFTFAAAKYTRRDFYSAAEWFGNKMLISQRFPSPCEISQSSVFPAFALLSQFRPDFFFQFLEISSTGII
ncbi:hypothetical protein AAG906_031227 [Vitis piasezkii]